MDIRELKFENGVPLIDNPTLSPVFEWLGELITHLSEEDFWRWLDEFYEKGPSAEQVEELRLIIDPENLRDKNNEPNWILWIALDQIWQNHYDQWHSRGLSPNKMGGWYWR